MLKFEKGWNYGINLYGTNKVIVFFDVLISTTQARAPGTSVFAFSIDNKVIIIDAPYNFTGLMYQNSSITNYIFCRNDTTRQYIAVPSTWNADTEVRVFGVYIGTTQS